MMVELDRPILLPPPESAGFTRARSTAVAPWAPALSVPATPPVPSATAEDSADAGSRFRKGPVENELGADTADGRRRSNAGLIAASSGIPFGTKTVAATPFASAAFLAQQIFQEAIPTGLHLEPWAQATGAYRRAGAAPPLESGAPALFSLAV